MFDLTMTTGLYLLALAPVMTSADILTFEAGDFGLKPIFSNVQGEFNGYSAGCFANVHPVSKAHEQFSGRYWDSLKHQPISRCKILCPSVSPEEG